MRTVLVGFEDVYATMLNNVFNTLGRILYTAEEEATYNAFRSLIIFILENDNSIVNWTMCIDMLFNDESLDPEAYVSARKMGEIAYVAIIQKISEHFPGITTADMKKIKYRQVGKTDFVLTF